MAREPASFSDWTATVEGAVAAEFVRRRFWLRAYLGLVLLLTLATLLLVWLRRDDAADRLTQALRPLAAATDRLSGQDVALARHQVDLGERLARLESEVQALDRELRAAPAAAPPPRSPTPAAPAVVLPAAVQRLPAQQARLGDALTAVDRRLQRVEAASQGVARGQAQIDQRLSRLDAAVAALERQDAAMQAPLAASAAPASAGPRLDRLEQRLRHLERTTVRSGAVDFD